MIRTVSFLAILVLLVPCLFAQGPVFPYGYLWTLSYEDLSDILRRYPGMHPLDYGTFGAPVLFRPFGLNPWELRAERDLIPQNRRGDGLYDTNLQPPSELDTIRCDFLAGGAAGQFRFNTRSVVVDTPYTEFQIREGYNGFGTVDIVHGQRVYQSLNLEVTGRLGWYNGMRTSTASRLVRLRGRLGFDLGKRWRAGVTYAGSHVDAESELQLSGPYTEREEAIFELNEKDSMRTALAPALRFYVRQDREDWGRASRLREGVGGWVVQAHANLPRQQFTFRHQGTYSQLDYPGVKELYETTAEVFVQDSLDLTRVGVRVFGALKVEAVANDPRDSQWKTLPDGGIEAAMPLKESVSMFGGLHYVDELWPVAWARAKYRIADRPVLIAPEFRDLSLWYVGQERGEDHYQKAIAGVRWQKDAAFVELTGQRVDRVGQYAEKFVYDGTVLTSQRQLIDENGTFAAALTAQIPLWYGLRLDSWSSWQSVNPSLSTSPSGETRSFSRLYFEHTYFKAPLIVRAHLSHEYLGEREAYSDKGLRTLPVANIASFRLSATIEGVTLMWGVDNFFAQHYELLPGYKQIAREEYIGVVWKLWL